MVELNLGNAPMFSGLEEEELERLSQKAKKHDFGVWSVIIREGNIEEKENQRMYIIKEGEVEVLKEDWAMNQIQVNTLKQGDFFGEMSLIDNEARSATVRALSDTVLYSLSHEDLESTLSEEGYTKVILNVGGEMAKRVEERFLRLADLLRVVKLDETGPSTSTSHADKMGRRFVESHHLFIGMKQNDLDKLFSRLKEQTFKRGEIITREGETHLENPSIYIIQDGGVSFIKKDSSGRPQKVGVMEGGNTFGVENLMGKLSGLTACPLTYEAFQNTDVYTLTDEELNQTLSKDGYATVALNMTRYLSRWLRACLERCATMKVLRGYLRV